MLLLYFVIGSVRGWLENSQYEMEHIGTQPKAIRDPEPRNNCALYCCGVTGTRPMPNPKAHAE